MYKIICIGTEWLDKVFVLRKNERDTIKQAYLATLGLFKNYPPRGKTWAQQPYTSPIFELGLALHRHPGGRRSATAETKVSGAGDWDGDPGSDVPTFNKILFLSLRWLIECLYIIVFVLRQEDESLFNFKTNQLKKLHMFF